ncbi:MAG TPA: N-acetyltransferase [Bdellovibrionales bacterium]|nr:ribosomal-protein-alanine acetyltransferase [Pseudobdellovibrionaceae bacterium]HAG90974.1 N-acetyltransferase [Bdellovibrionales bacterium]|tara:strand:+ start:20263 stop:20898 length:636 start_codon:yes stop_codon:yes gene_type:complete
MAPPHKEVIKRMPMKHLYRSTKNLIIRPLGLKDYESWRESLSINLERQNPWDRKKRESSELSKNSFKSVLSLQKSQRDRDEYYDLTVFEKKSGLVVGGVSAMNVVRSVSQTAFLGYSIHNIHWGKGYGKESVKAMIEIAFRDLKLHRLEAGVEPSNRRSIMLARSVGLRKEGLKKRAVLLRGEWRDLTIYSITCEDLKIPWKGEVTLRKSR